jgi:chemotaxis protein histidine kinase CheA
VPRDLQQYFRIEGRELLAALRQGLQERSLASAEDRRVLMRILHTLKGAASIGGHADIEDAVQGLEGVLGAARLSGTARAEATAVVNELEQMFATLELSAAPSDAARRVSEAAAALDAAGREALDRLLAEIAQARGQAGHFRVVPLERIEVPVSPGSLSALDVASGAARALVPLDAVRTVVRLSGARVKAGAGGAMVQFEREMVPLVSLRLAAGLSTDVRSTQETAADADEDRFALIVDSTAGLVALGVRGPGRVVTVHDSDWDRFLRTIEALITVLRPSARKP